MKNEQMKIYLRGLDEYSIENEKTGEINEGISVKYLIPSNDSKKTYGYVERKCSCPLEYRKVLEKYTNLREVLAEFEYIEQFDGSFKRRIIKINGEKVR